MLRPGIRRLLRLRPLDTNDVLREVDDEVQLHIELRADQLEREGMDRAQALSEARRRFAHASETLNELYCSAQERNQHMRILERWESLWQDTRYAARGLLRDPMLTVFIVVTLALGVGANVTAFSLVDRLLLRGPEHVSEPDQLVRLHANVPRGTGTEISSWIPYPIYQNMRAGMTTMNRIGAYRVTESLLGRGRAARRVRLGQSTGAFFEALGTAPLHGRFFSAEEDAAVAGGLAVLSEHVWRSDFAGDPDVLGQTIVANDALHTIVGIAPAGFSGLGVRRVDVWILADSRTAGQVNWNIVGRLAADGSIAAVSADGAAVHRRTAETGPRWMREATIFGAPITFGDYGREPLESTMARWLAGVSVIILLITLANVVNLLLVRLTRHRRELAIRVALGAGRARIVRLLAMEGVLLALVSGVASLAVARVVEPIVRQALFADEAAWTFTLIDLRVIGTLAVMITITGLIVGIVPALQAGSPRLAGALRSGTRGSGTRHNRIRSILTVAQAALSVALLVGAGLFLRSLAEVRALDLGTDADQVIVASAELPRSAPAAGEIFDYITNEREVYRRLLDAVRRLSGVERASIAVGLPLDGGSFSASVWVPGRDSMPSLPGLGPYASVVTTDYFATVGTQILRGRAFGDGDREGSEQVVIVGETMARTLWPERDAVGECIHISRATAPCTRVVGIAEDVHRVGLREDRTPQYYLALGQQQMFGGASIVVRPGTSASVTGSDIQKAILDAEPSVRSVDIELLVDRLNGELRPLRLGMVTFGLSAALALLVAVLGLYSLMAYLVAWRTHEIGVRLALGATERHITRLVVGSGTALAALGVLLGIALAFTGGRWLEPHLFNTPARDPLVLASVASLLVLVALLAGWIPAMRAVRISPTEALRAE